MRYTSGTDWVDIAGAAERTMRELIALDNEGLEKAHETMVTLTTDACFCDRDGNAVDWRTDVLGLTVQQWSWWKSRVWAAARDERISPEA
jgi:hypothetical protein